MLSKKVAQARLATAIQKSRSSRKCRSSSLGNSLDTRKYVKVAVQNCCSKSLVSVAHSSVPLHSPPHYSMHVYAQVNSSI